MDTVPIDRHFRKDERLSGKLSTDRLFEAGKGFIAYPLRFVYYQSEAAEKAKVRILISVPKKKIRHAVDRNRIKRLIREAYRLNKQLLTDVLESDANCLHLGIIYLSNEPANYGVIEEKMIAALQKLRLRVSNKE